MKKPKRIKIPTYITDRRQLMQITQVIINGKLIVKEIPLKAYHIIERPSNRG